MFAATIIGTHIGDYFNMDELKPAYERGERIKHLSAASARKITSFTARPVLPKRALM
jgi:hypothetical protein